MNTFILLIFFAKAAWSIPQFTDGQCNALVEAFAMVGTKSFCFDSSKNEEMQKMEDTLETWRINK